MITKRPFGFHKISFSILTIFSLLWLTSFSCEDHVVPDSPVVVETIEFDADPNTERLSIFFNLQFTSLSKSKSVIEYGIISVDDALPAGGLLIGAAGVEKLIFLSPVVLNKKLTEKYGSHDYTQFFYRAYAILSDGTKVYGEVKSYL